MRTIAATNGNKLVADTVYPNGKSYIVNPEQPWAQAVAVKNGHSLIDYGGCLRTAENGLHCTPEAIEMSFGVNNHHACHSNFLEASRSVGLDESVARWAIVNAHSPLKINFNILRIHET